MVYADWGFYFPVVEIVNVINVVRIVLCMDGYSVKVGGPELRFSAAHFIYNTFFKEPLHGHNYEVDVEVGGILGDDGFIMNFLVLKEIVKKVVGELDHRVLLPTLNPLLRVSGTPNVDREISVVCSGGEEYLFPSRDVFLLPVKDTSSEELAHYLASSVWTKLREFRTNVSDVVVRLYETPYYSAAYTVTASNEKP
ncbi:MAG: 6-carboxytetrahydropterin synthase [Thermoprotei archaeon]